MTKNLLAKQHEDPRLIPVVIGNTWRRDPDTGKFVLPERSLGYAILGWGLTMLRHKNKPFKLTNEQARFLLWWYAIDEEGKFIYRRGHLQRLKGWGKSPFAAYMAAVEFVGPCRFGGWNEDGTPRVIPQEGGGWVQIAATSEAQTKNTMHVFRTLFSNKAKKKYKIVVMETIWALDRQCRIEPVTSNPDTLQGNPITFVICDETQHWYSSNSGQEMWDIIKKNATKSAGGTGRALCITNAYNPIEGSVAQELMEAYKREQTDDFMNSGTYVDSLEASEFAPMSAREIDAMKTVLITVMGDSTWLDIDAILSDIFDTSSPESSSRRFWYNSVTYHDERWVDILNWRAGVRKLHVGKDEPAVMFLDCSKNDDATALAVARVSDGYVFDFYKWQKPPRAKSDWLMPREDVDAYVEKVMSSYNIVGFWCDPSHTKEDGSKEHYWSRFVNGWNEKYRHRLTLWAQSDHAINWDMTEPLRGKKFIEETMLTAQDIGEGLLLHNGNEDLDSHVANCFKQKDLRWDGFKVVKQDKHSQHKIDGAVSMIGTQMMCRAVKRQKTKQVSDTKGWF